MKRSLSTIISCGLFFATTTVTFAHAFVDHATPKVGSTVTDAPTNIQIEFTENLDESQSTIEVYDSAGKQIDKKDTHLDARDKALLIVSLPSISPGTYKVVWHVVAADTHKTHSDFEFTYKPKT